VNGVGKTTTIGKLAHKFKSEGKNVLLAAGDTFRAGAIEQLEVWGQRVGVDVIKQSSGSDPAAVMFDAVQAAKQRKVDVLLCDTAGRLQNKTNLMEELNKIFRVIQRELPDAPHEVLLVLDATTGQNALSQAKLFGEKSGVTGLVLTKLDGTAKGGIVVAIRNELNLPVKLVGLGEKMGDLQTFDSEQFVHALFAGLISKADEQEPSA
jgi:fused signal recognition particle receptor